MSTAEFDDASSPSPDSRAQASARDGESTSTTQGAARVVAPEQRGQIYTMHAHEGVNAAELINSALKRRIVGSTEPRRLTVTAPSGPSTSGGRMARQAITLVPTSGQGPAVMIGFLDVGQKAAGVRAHEVVAKQYKARFGARFDTSADEYRALTRDLTGMLSTLGFAVGVDELRDDGRSHPPLAAQRMSPLVWLAGGLLVLAVVAIALLSR